MTQHHGASDVGAVVSGQSLFGYGHIVFDLPFKGLADLLHIDDVSEFDDALDCEAVPVGEAEFLRLLDIL